MAFLLIISYLINSFFFSIYIFRFFLLEYRESIFPSNSS